MGDGAGDDAKGRLKKAGGEVTGDDSLKREGQVDKASGKVKDAVDSVKDKVQDVLHSDND